MKFQDKFYGMPDHNKCPSSEKEHEKCIFRLSYFHRIQPTDVYCLLRLYHDVLISMYCAINPDLDLREEGELLADDLPPAGGRRAQQTALHSLHQTVIQIRL